MENANLLRERVLGNSARNVGLPDVANVTSGTGQDIRTRSSRTLRDFFLRSADKFDRLKLPRGS